MARAATRLGVRKIRLTGGEPLLRKDVEAAGAQIVALVRALEADGQIVISRSEGDFVE